jgi:outer membrane biosynthesis protein TonB
MTSPLVSLIRNDDEILTKSRKTGLISTAAVWVVLLLIFAFVPVFKKKPEYKTVHITLASTPLKKTQKAAEPVKTAEAVKTEEPVKKAEPVQKDVEPPKPSAVQKKPEPAKRADRQKSAPAADKAKTSDSPTVYKKSVEELMAEQSRQKNKDVKWDDSLFTGAAESSSQTPSTDVSGADKITGSSALSGTAAAAAASDNEPVNATAVSDKVKSAGADAAVKKALGNISSTTYTQTSGSGMNSRTSVNTSINSDGKVSIELKDGSVRMLLYPERPAIRISEENAKRIDSTRTVRVQFKILSKGNVPLSDINITPSSILTPEIRQEIREQVSLWRFSQASSDGYAAFEYTIEFKK